MESGYTSGCERLRIRRGAFSAVISATAPQVSAAKAKGYSIECPAVLDMIRKSYAIPAETPRIIYAPTLKRTKAAKCDIRPRDAFRHDVARMTHGHRRARRFAMLRAEAQAKADTAYTRAKTGLHSDYPDDTMQIRAVRDRLGSAYKQTINVKRGYRVAPRIIR